MGIRPSATPGDQHVCVTTCPNNQWQSVPHEFGGLSFIIPPYYTASAYGPQPPLGINMSALQHVPTPSGKASPHEFGGGHFSAPPTILHGHTVPSHPWGSTCLRYNMSKHPVAKRPPMRLGGSFPIPPYYTAWAYGPQPPLGLNMSALQHVQTPSGKASPHEFGGVFSQAPLLYCMGIRPSATPGDRSVCVTTCMGHVTSTCP